MVLSHSGPRTRTRTYGPSADLKQSCRCGSRGADIQVAPRQRGLLTDLNHPALAKQMLLCGRCATLALRMLQQRMALPTLNWIAAYSGNISGNFRNFGVCVCAKSLVSGKGIGCKLHISAHFNQLAAPTRNNFSLRARTRTEIPEKSGKVSVCVIHGAMDARNAHDEFSIWAMPEA